MDQITVYGAPWCPDCRRSKTFLGEQRIPYTWVDIDADAAGLRFVEELQGGGRTIPTIVFPDGSHLLEPSNPELAEKLGLQLRASRSVYDILILGGGPAGLSAAIYAAREGMDALVLERGALGGQAGATDRIDNYPGFPDGIGGAELADRLVAHAKRYGVETVAAAEIAGVTREPNGVMVTTAAGDTYGADAAIVATGSRYRRLGIPGEEGLIGLGVHYCATCDGPFYRGAEEIVVIGGGNSALEESLFLAGLAKHVTILTRGDLRASELVRDKVLGHSRITVHTGVDLVAVRAPRRTPRRRASTRSGDGERLRPGAGGGVRLRGPRPEHAVPARDRRPRRPRVRDHGRPLSDLARRPLRGRRRAIRLDEAGRQRRRRGDRSAPVGPALARGTAPQGGGNRGGIAGIERSPGRYAGPAGACPAGEGRAGEGPATRAPP